MHLSFYCNCIPADNKGVELTKYNDDFIPQHVYGNHVLWYLDVPSLDRYAMVLPIMGLPRIISRGSLFRAQIYFFLAKSDRNNYAFNYIKITNYSF